jgi:hypothetical protein
MRSYTCFIPIGVLLAALSMGAILSAKEFLTPEEIEKVQLAREIDKRIGVYLDAAELRLMTALDRLNGKESPPEHPLEFFSVEEMIDGYYKIFDSIMFNLDDAFQNPGVDIGKVKKALKDLEKKTEQNREELEIIQKKAEEKELVQVWQLVEKALEINDGAHEGAQYGLESLKDKKPQ